MAHSSDFFGPVSSRLGKEEDNSGNDKGYTPLCRSLEKSESEDSGVELFAINPYGSESSNNPKESEKLKRPVLDKIETHFTYLDLESSASKETDILLISDSEKLQSYTYKDLAVMEASLTGNIEKDMTGIPVKMEQPVLRSRKQRGSRELHDNLSSQSCQHYLCSLKDQHRLKPSSNLRSSPPRPPQVKEDKDLLPLPGGGLQYLEKLCFLLEQIAELQQKNQRLQQEKREVEDRLYSQVSFIDACVCDSRPPGVSYPDSHEGCFFESSTWKTQHYRKRSSSHTGVLHFMSQYPDNALAEANKLESHFVSVPNLREEGRSNLREEGLSNLNQRSKTPHANASQWDKIKSFVSKLALKVAGNATAQSVTSAEKQYKCRSPKLQKKNSSNPHQRLFLPKLVIRSQRQRVLHHGHPEYQRHSTRKRW